MLSVGNTLLICTPKNNKEHLFIIIAMEESSNTALLVSFATPKIGCDESCCVNAGEHSFLIYNSVVNYADARTSAISNIEYCLNNGIYKKHNPVSGKLLQKIQAGALKSLAISKKHLDFLKSNI
jgi:hypothetical protein